jgi:hypothetical protein
LVVWKVLSVIHFELVCIFLIYYFWHLWAHSKALIMRFMSLKFASKMIRKEERYSHFQSFLSKNSEFSLFFKYIKVVKRVWKLKIKILTILYQSIRKSSKLDHKKLETTQIFVKKKIELFDFESAFRFFVSIRFFIKQRLELTVSFFLSYHFRCGFQICKAHKSSFKISSHALKTAIWKYIK